MSLPSSNRRHPIRFARIALQRDASTSRTAPIYAICAQPGRAQVLLQWTTVPSRPRNRVGHARSEMPLTSLEFQLPGGHRGSVASQHHQNPLMNPDLRLRESRREVRARYERVLLKEELITGKMDSLA